MKIGLLINDILTEHASYTTPHLAMTAAKRGHEVYVMGVSDFIYGGDVRLFVMNGHPLEKDGVYAASRRVNKSGDARSNISAGGGFELAEPDADALKLVEMVRPKLVHDGMHFVGLDVVGDKLMEVNVFSPGGINTVHKLTGVDFSDVIIEDLERKVQYQSYYGGQIGNGRLATL